MVRHPNHAPFLAWKLWSYFIPTPPTKSAMQMMVGNYLSSGYNLRPLLRVILRHPAMFQDLDAPDLVKGPIVFVASTLRMTKQFITEDSWAWLLEAMGQVPFYPPNVSGWDQGPAWLNTNSAHAYWQTTDYLIRDTVGDPGQESASAAVSRAHLGALASVGLERRADEARGLRTVVLRRPQLRLRRASTCSARTSASSASACCGRSSWPAPTDSCPEPHRGASMTACGCNDWHTTQRAAMLRRQGQRVPIPRAVLEGATAGLSRSDFLRNGAIATITVYGASMLSWGRIWEAAAAQAATPGGVTDPIIVSIFLDGGNDGLNTLVPVDNQNYAAYAQARNYIGLDPNDCLALGGPAATPDFKWNPAATGFQSALRRRQDGRHPRRRLPAARPEPLPLPRLLAGRRARSQPGDGLAGPLGRPERRPRQPAPGALGRLDASGLDEERGQPGGGADQPAVGAVRPERGVDGRVADGADARRPRAQRTPKHAPMAAADKAVGGAVDVANQLAGARGDHDPAERARIRHDRLRRPHVDAGVADPLEPGRAGRLPAASTTASTSTTTR